MKALFRTLLAAALLVASGCSSFLKSRYADTVPPATGTESVSGLAQPVRVSRDRLGIPLIEAESESDLAFAAGWVAAEDRLSQMLGMRTMAQGRLAEFFGEELLDIDVYMRTLDLTRVARMLYEPLSEDSKARFARYAEGVNAYLATHPLPPDLQLAGTRAEPWAPTDSMAIFALFNLGLAFNLHEELAYLRLAQKLGAEKAAWLVPIYPDEPLPFAEAKRLEGIDLSVPVDALEQLEALQPKLAALHQRPFAASNNWAVHPSRTRDGASILANDTHVPLAMPSYWHYVHLVTPQFHAAGVALAGIPGVVAGTNGSLAWGMTMVMSDNQDLFLEELRVENGRLLYRKGEEWLPTRERIERFRTKGGAVVERKIHETRHGPLLNAALTSSKFPLMTPLRSQSRFGLALSWAMYEPDDSAEAFFRFSRARSVEEAEPIVRAVQVMPLNIVYADRDNIAWQVTGRYPVRANGRGLLPAPGWVETYDWTGYLDTRDHPFAKNPPEGFVGTANHRSIPADAPHVLSSSWFFPERSERIHSLLAADRAHTLEATQAMQYDRTSLFVPKLQDALRRLGGEGILSTLDGARARAAKEAFDRLMAFDGDLSTESVGASVLAALFHSFAIRTFGDELGYPDDLAWEAFVRANEMSYSALPDHLVQREDSPFWDDVRTPRRESKREILAESLADAIELLEDRLGSDHEDWGWGRLHTYRFQTDGGRISRLVGGTAAFGFWWVEDFFDRGPFPAGGDHTTLNVAAYQMGQDFDTWLIPAMRIAVDFSREEPMVGLNSTGQSGNPASGHYEDGIHAWLDGGYQAFPFEAQRRARHYSQRKTLVPR